MNGENKRSGIDAAAGKINSQRVSVIKWSGKVSTLISKEKSIFKQAYTFPVAEEESFVSSSPIVGSSNSAGKYQCLFCGKSFKWHSHWKSHERTHTGERPFQCEMCGKSFARSDGLQCHKLTHIAKNPSYFSRTEEDVKAAPCKYPPAEREKSVVATTQKDVSREHEKAKLFNCHHCDRIFFSSAGMVKHMQVHKGRNNFVCEECNMIFTKRSAMEVHSRVHTGVKPFQCNICSKAFSIYGNLKRHILIHTGERPYKCCQCSNSFNNPSHLARHFKKKHDGEQPTRHFKNKYGRGQN